MTDPHPAAMRAAKQINDEVLGIDSYDSGDITDLARIIERAIPVGEIVKVLMDMRDSLDLSAVNTNTHGHRAVNKPRIKSIDGLLARLNGGAA